MMSAQEIDKFLLISLKKPFTGELSSNPAEESLINENNVQEDHGLQLSVVRIFFF